MIKILDNNISYTKNDTFSLKIYLTGSKMREIFTTQGEESA